MTGILFFVGLFPENGCRFFRIIEEAISENETIKRWNPMSSSGFEPYALKSARWGQRAPPFIESLRLGDKPPAPEGRGRAVGLLERRRQVKGRAETEAAGDFVKRGIAGGELAAGLRQPQVQHVLPWCISRMQFER